MGDVHVSNSPKGAIGHGRDLFHMLSLNDEFSNQQMAQEGKPDSCGEYHHSVIKEERKKWPMNGSKEGRPEGERIVPNHPFAMGTHVCLPYMPKRHGACEQPSYRKESEAKLNRKSTERINRHICASNATHGDT